MKKPIMIQFNDSAKTVVPSKHIKGYSMCGSQIQIFNDQLYIVYLNYIDINEALLDKKILDSIFNPKNINEFKKEKNSIKKEN